MSNYIEQLRTRHNEINEDVKNLKNTKKAYEDVMENLESIRDELSLEVMVGVPSTKTALAFLEGVAVHTNELYLPLGNNYYAKGTTKDALQFCTRKCENIKDKIEALIKEDKLLLERLGWLQINSENAGQADIVEIYDDEQELKWREKHRISVRKMKEQESAERKMNKKSADYYFQRLEELELEEQMAESLTLTES